MSVREIITFPYLFHILSRDVIVYSVSAMGANSGDSFSIRDAALFVAFHSSTGSLAVYGKRTVRVVFRVVESTYTRAVLRRKSAGLALRPSAESSAILSVAGLATVKVLPCRSGTAIFQNRCDDCVRPQTTHFAAPRRGSLHRRSVSSFFSPSAVFAIRARARERCANRVKESAIP